MPIELPLFLLAYLIAYSLLFFVGYLLFSLKERKYFREESPDSLIGDFTVIIPFRNEALRIHKLLDSLLKASALPKEIIFIDDHSTDDTARLITERLHAIPHTMLSLPEEKTGKKHAIRQGIKQATSNYILTIDADTYFNPTYFLSLKSLPQRDLIILPVMLRGEKFTQHFFEIDLILLNALNIAGTGWYRPIIASGANLLFSKNAFYQFDQFKQHEHIASGDDIYLLRDFRRAKASIQVVTKNETAIFTETPRSISEFFSQRLRWFSKSSNVNDRFSMLLGGIQFFFTLAFFALMIRFGWQLNYTACVLLYLSKTLIDLVCFFPIAFCYRQIVAWLLLPIYELLLPIYVVTIGLLSFTVQPSWKNRKITAN